jgi:hypothetical protein
VNTQVYALYNRLCKCSFGVWRLFTIEVVWKECNRLHEQLQSGTGSIESPLVRSTYMRLQLQHCEQVDRQYASSVAITSFARFLRRLLALPK